MLTSFPSDLSINIVQNWLQASWKDICRLDVAYCNHQMRSGWLNLARQPALKFKDDESIFQLIGLVDNHPIHLLHWAIRRQVAISVLQINTVFIPRSLDEPFSLPSVTKLRVFGSRLKASVEEMKKLFSYFPGLVAVDCASWYRLGEYVAALEGITQPLRRLALPPDQPIISAGESVLKKFSSHLEELQMGYLAERQLDLLQCCLSLQSLSLRLRRNDWPTAVNGLISCLEKMKDLRKLKLTSDDLVDDQLVQQLVIHCPNLHVLDLENCPLVTLKSLQMCFDHCKTIQKISLPKAAYEVALMGEEEEKTKKCSLTSTSQRLSTEDALQVLSVCPWTIQSLKGRTGWLEANSEFLRQLANEHGKILQDFQGCSIARDVTASDMESFLLSCPCLTNLAYGPYIGLNDELLRRIPSLCPQLNSFAVFGAVQIHDDAMIAMLEGLADRPMRSLRLLRCPHLTDRVAIRIGELFPHGLAKLSLHGNAMSRETTELIVRRLFSNHPCMLATSFCNKASHDADNEEEES